MSAVLKPIGENLVEFTQGAKPLEKPPLVQDPISVEYMRADLAASGLTVEEMRAYPTARNFQGCGVYVMDFADAKGMWVKRTNLPNVPDSSSGKKPAKYVGPRGATGIWFPEGQSRAPLSAGTTLYLIEGEKKASKFKKQFPELNVVGIRGHGGWSYAKALHPQLLEFLGSCAQVLTVFDADIAQNTKIQHSARKLSQALTNRGIGLVICKPPMGKGVDDWLVADPTGVAADLLTIDTAVLEYPRLMMLQRSDIYVDAEGKFTPNANAAYKICKTLFTQSGVTRDKYFGLTSHGEPTSQDELYHETIKYILGVIHGKFPVRDIKLGLDMALREVPETNYVRDMVLGAMWDGTPRLNTWGSKYIPARNPKLADEWGRQLATATFARITRPGCKADTVYTLVGRQGNRKSSFCETWGQFGEYDGYRALTTFKDEHDRDQASMLAHATVVDISEGIALTSKASDIAVAKHIITRRDDRHRPVYALSDVTEPRGFVWMGTGNRPDLYYDNTGNRRYFPIRTLDTGFVLPVPLEEKLQLLAEVHETVNLDAEGEDAWWQLRFSLEDVDESIREDNPGVTDVHELLLSQHRAIDPIEVALRDGFAEKKFPTYSGDGTYKGCQFVTAHMMLAFTEVKTQRAASSIMGGMVYNTNLPFAIVKSGVDGAPKPSINKLDLKGMKAGQIYDNDTKADAQLRGFWLVPKPLAGGN